MNLPPTDSATVDSNLATQSVPQMPVSNLPVTESSPVSRPGIISEHDFDTTDPEKRKLIQKQFVLLLHAHKCQKREDESSGEVKQCLLRNCRPMKYILNHMKRCDVGKSCSVPYCISSRQIVSHWKKCEPSDCPVCLPLKEASDRKQQQGAIAVQKNQASRRPALADKQQVYAAPELPFNSGNGSANTNPVIQSNPTVGVSNVNDQTPQGSQNLNHGKTPQPVRPLQLQLPAQIRGILRSIGLRAISNPALKNLLISEVLLAKVKVGSLALINSPPNEVAPVGQSVVPDNPTTTKDWHRAFTRASRDLLTVKIIRSIFPACDLSDLIDKRMDNLVAYALKVERVIYATANSIKEYYELLALKICNIQKELEEKRQKRKLLAKCKNTIATDP